MATMFDYMFPDGVQATAVMEYCADTIIMTVCTRVNDAKVVHSYRVSVGMCANYAILRNHLKTWSDLSGPSKDVENEI